MRLICLLLMFICSTTFAQNLTFSDTLKKYSYFTMGANFEDTTGHECFGQGTGFFIKKMNQKFYVTAKHVLVNCDYYGDTLGCKPDKMMVMYNDSDKIRIGLSWRIDLTNLKSRYKCLPVYQSPDTITVHKKDTSSIYSIENTISNSSVYPKDEIVIYGYPLVNNTKSGWYTIKSPSKIASKNLAFDTSFYVSDKKGFRHQDTINFRIYTSDFKITPELAGFSGSPVFTYDGEKKRWFFIGVLSSIDTSLNVLFVTKSKYIIE